MCVLEMAQLVQEGLASRRRHGAVGARIRSAQQQLPSRLSWHLFDAGKLDRPPLPLPLPPNTVTRRWAPSDRSLVGAKKKTSGSLGSKARSRFGQGPASARP